MEYKIIEEYFLRCFSLPEQFHFAEYMSVRFQSFIFELVEVSPISWFVLIALVGINYGRIVLIDPLLQQEVCLKFGRHRHPHPPPPMNHNNTSPGHYPPNEHISPACDQYTLRVIFIYAVMLSLYIFFVFLYSNRYMQSYLSSAIAAVMEYPQSRCEQHIPFRKDCDTEFEFRDTGYNRALYKVMHNYWYWIVIEYISHTCVFRLAC